MRSQRCYQSRFEDLLSKVPGSKIEYYTEDDVEWIRFVYPPGGGIICDERPLDVDGSIVVYHKTKHDHIVGYKNYRIGKVLHIPRPKAIDKDGNWVWCDIRAKDGVYTRTIPQSFLDSAVYPIIINDTFGYWSTGGGKASLGQDFRAVLHQPRPIAVPQQVPQPAGVVGISINVIKH